MLAQNAAEPHGVGRRLANFIVTFAVKIVGSGKTLKIGYRFEIPD